MAEFHQTYIYGRGWIEVIVGGMFSGKTEELIRRLRRAEYARQNIQVFKPIIDDRYHKEDVTSHNYNSIKANPIHKSKDILDLLKPETQVVGIDEGQFFDHEIVSIASELASRGIRVLVAGLDTDWQAKPFGPMPTLMAIAESVTKQHAVCVVCGAPASRTQRTSPNLKAKIKLDQGSQNILKSKETILDKNFSEAKVLNKHELGQASEQLNQQIQGQIVEQLSQQVLVGSDDVYEARCRDHFKPEVVEPSVYKRSETSPDFVL